MGGAGTAEDAAAAAMWRAAADAMAWTASMCDHAAWTERQRGWADKSEADEALKRAAGECGDAIDAGGGVDADAAARAVGALRIAADAAARAAGAFGRSSGRHREAESEQNLAAAAYERAADRRSGGAVRERAAQSDAHAQDAERLASDARGAARALARNAGRLEACAAAWPTFGRKRVGDHDELASMQADMHDDARQACPHSAAMERRAADAGRLAAEVRGMAAAAAGQSAAKAEEVASKRGLRGTRVKRAAAAWKRAAAAASRLAEAERRRLENRAA